MKPAFLFNGAADPAVLPWHRGLHYGDGVFRTCLIYASQCFDLEAQIEKLRRDALALDLQPPPSGLLAEESLALSADAPQSVLKLLLLRSGGERGYRSGAVACDRLLCRYPAPSYPAASWDRGIRAFRSDFRLAPLPALAGLKHLNRLEQVLACRAWQEGAEEAIVADAEGRPLCGTRSNLFWASGGVLRTAPLDQCGVAGLTRDKVLAAAAVLSLRTGIAPGSWDELEAADEAFVTNSLVGIWPLASLDSRAWRAPGPLTRRLMEQLRHPRLVQP